MRTYCKVCGGKGTIDDPKNFGKLMGYCGRNGEYLPQMECPNCFGVGFTGEPDGTSVEREGRGDEKM